MKKKKRIVLLSVVIITILLSFFIGHAYAKYRSKVTGKGTVDIAGWNFKVNEKEDKIQTISLKSTINNGTLLNNKVAPGTEGDFQIRIDATGTEVGINYIINFENQTEKPKNLKFTYEGKTYNSLEDLQKDLTGIINANEENKTKILTIGWNWKYQTGTTENEINTNNKIDTQDAKKISNYTFDIIVSGVQVSPQN